MLQEHNTGDYQNVFFFEVLYLNQVENENPPVKTEEHTYSQSLKSKKTDSSQTETVEGYYLFGLFIK